MRKAFSPLVCALLVVSSSALAAPNSPGLRGILGMEAGNYSFVQYDKGQLQKQYLDILEKRSREDRDYFLGVVNDIEGEFVSLVKHSVYGSSGLKHLSDISTRAGAKQTPAEDFLNALNEYNMSRLALETKINSLTALAGALPSQIAIKADGSGMTSVPGYGNINFTPVKDFYVAKLADLTTYLSNLPHAIALPTGPWIIAENSGKGLVLDSPAFQFSADQIRDMHKRALELRQWDAKAEETVNQYTVYVKRLVQKFISTYGSTERYRFHDAAYAKQKQEAAKDIAIAFWTRSYLRTVYGMPLGAIGIPYAKRMANLDFFTASTKGLAQFMEEPVWDQREMIQIEQNYRLALNTADARASSIMDGSVSLIRRATALVTFLGGNSELADAMKTVLTLMAADFYEEKIIMQPGGLRQMTTRYRARYLVTDADKAFYKSLEASYDPESGSQSDDPYGGTGAIASGSLAKQFESVKLECKTMEVKLAQAEQIETQINNATQIASKQQGNRVERRRRIHD